MLKVNDLSNSKLRKKYFENQFIPENDNAIESLRVSSKKQERGQSFLEQKEITTLYAKKEKLKVLRSWQVSESASKHADRKHFNEMLEYIRESQKTKEPIKHIIFSHQSRSTRNKQSARELEELVEMGVTLHFARDGRKLTCQSDLSELILWLMENIKNEAFIAELTQNSMGGIIKCIEKGMSPVAVPPLGIKSVGEKDTRRWIPDGDAAEYVRYGFQKILEQEGTRLTESFVHNLWEELEEKFPLVKSPSYKQFPRIFRNEHYYGDIVYAGEVYRGNPDRIVPLVSKRDWCRVQDILNGRVRGRRLQKEDGHEFEGLIKCNGRILDEKGNPTEVVCGASISGETVYKTYVSGKVASFTYYRCSTIKSKHRCSQRDKVYMKEVAGRAVSYREVEIVEFFKEIFKSFQITKEVCDEMSTWLWDEHFEQKKKTEGQLEKLSKRKKQLENFIEKSYEDKIKGDVPEEIWKKNTAKWSLECEQISKEIDVLVNEKEEYVEKGVEFIELMQNIEIIYDKAPLEKKRELVELVISNPVLCDGKLDFELREPFKYLVSDDKKNPETSSGCFLEKWGG